jgi:hypothetical protein
MRSAQAIGLDEVALNCGFCDKAHFRRHLRRYFGITPAAFLEGTQSDKQLQPVGSRTGFSTGCVSPEVFSAPTFPLQNVHRGFLD